MDTHPHDDTWDYDNIPPPPPRVEQLRDRRNSFESPRNQRDRDGWAAARWTLNGWTYQQIADALDLASKSTAHYAVQRGLHSIQDQTDEEIRKSRAAHRARLTYVLEEATEIFEKNTPLVSQGRVMKGDDGEPLVDYGVKLAAAGKVKELSESLRKLDGLDAATKLDTNVTVNPQDIELAEIIRQAEAKNAAQEEQIRDGSAGA